MRPRSQAKISSHRGWELGTHNHKTSHDTSSFIYLYYGAVDDEVTNTAVTGGVEEAGIGSIRTVVDLSCGGGLAAVAAPYDVNTSQCTLRWRATYLLVAGGS